MYIYFPTWSLEPRISNYQSLHRFSWNKKCFKTQEVSKKWRSKYSSLDQPYPKWWEFTPRCQNWCQFNSQKFVFSKGFWGINTPGNSAGDLCGMVSPKLLCQIFCFFAFAVAFHASFLTSQQLTGIFAISARFRHVYPKPLTPATTARR